MRLIVTTVALFLAFLLYAGQNVLAQSCGELSYQRNAIFKRAGYCFKTAAQIRNFGNAGCQYDDQADVPLSARDRAQISQILAEEHAAGCR